jgi:thioredoxin reductase
MKHEVIVIGGSYTGMAAALQLAEPGAPGPVSSGVAPGDFTYSTTCSSWNHRSSETCWGAP